MASPHVKAIDSASDLTSALSSRPADAITLVDFWATWCGPCKMISPVFERLAGQWRQVQFLKVDVDKNIETAQRYGVTAMPTFVVLKGGNKIDEMKGANRAGLEALLRKHAGAPESSAPGISASHSGSVEESASLYSHLDLQQISCLNENPAHTFKDLMKRTGNGGGYLQSDADEQLLMNITCQNALKIKALKFKSATGEEDKAPKRIKLFVNNPTLGFDDAESLEPAQELTLTPSQASGSQPVELRYVRFQKVNSLQVFVLDNQGGGDVTRLYGVEVYGADTGDAADWDAFKKKPE